MAPCQFATQCVANLYLEIGQVKLPEIAQVGVRKSLGQFGSKGVK